ncbi:MAG: hypothetical protein HUU50_23095 [Candidatus Brocadiae bacterium]|nr:hypothetical protein [Candidatus Brocadiia bacterium]
MRENVNIYIYFGFLFFLFFFSLFWHSISDDSVYYLGIARDIYHGLVPYKDVYSIYSPVMMYLNAFLFLLSENFSYPIFLSFQYIMLSLSAILLFRINSAFFSLEKKKAALVSIFFMIACMSSDGTYINLEIYVIFFVFCSLFSFFQKKYMLTGIFLGMSFFCKQYGLLNFLPFYFALLWEENKIKKIMALSLGGLVPLAVFLWYYCFYQAIDMAVLFNQIRAKGYTQDYPRTAISYLYIFWGGKVFFLFLLPVLLQNRKVFQNKTQFFLFLGVVVNFLPALIQSFQHYFILTFPYLFLLLGIAFFTNKPQKIAWKALHVSVILVIVLLALRLYRYKDLAQEHILVARHIEKEIPKGSTILLEGWVRYLYLMNEYQNPLLREIGYNFSFSWKEEWTQKWLILSCYKKQGLSPQKIIFFKNHIFYLYGNAQTSK